MQIAKIHSSAIELFFTTARNILFFNSDNGEDCQVDVSSKEKILNPLIMLQHEFNIASSATEVFKKNIFPVFDVKVNTRSYQLLLKDLNSDCYK